VVGAVSVTEAFLPILFKSSAPRLIFVTSSLGSLAYTSDKNSRHYGPYANELRVSKAALNMAMVGYANHPKLGKIKVLGADPGFLATNLTGNPDALRKMGATEPEVGGQAVASVVKGEKDADMGKVTGLYGVTPW
jgi:NAD(P)-dependent dehydrogenase (short-subunit alcohol dehydrogenase family)